MWVKSLEQQNCTNLGHVTPVKKNPASVKEGWLGKKETLWYTRYCVLLPQLMMYFRWKRDKQPQAVIPFFKATEVQNNPKAENQFILVDPGKKDNYQFRCSDKFSRQDWVNAI